MEAPSGLNCRSQLQPQSKRTDTDMTTRTDDDETMKRENALVENRTRRDGSTASETSSNPSATGPGALPPASRWRLLAKVDWKMGIGLVAVLSFIPVWRATVGHAKPTVVSEGPIPAAVIKIGREDLARELVCEAELRPYQEIDLHAKVAGYLQRIDVDIGDKVEAGQLLAIIEVPELADDIERARAELKRRNEEVARAQATFDQDHLVYTRLSSVDKSQPGLVAQQELDAALEKDRTGASALAAAQAEVDVARAELNKLQTMLKYSRITAPFAGIVTKRYADPGALIQAGTSSSTQTLPLVRLSQNDRLRLSFPVSVSYIPWVKAGDPVRIRVDSLDKPIEARISRLARKVETATRTMIVEADLTNADYNLVPGMYASVLLRLEHRPNALAVPIEAVSREQACSVLVVDKENRVEDRPVTLGFETPEKIEVLAGLTENDLVVIGHRSQFKPGQFVRPCLSTR
jgi:RND family efflux transporter MFP subunit